MRSQSFALLSVLILCIGLGACATMPDREVAGQPDGVTPAAKWHERVDSYLNQPLYMKRY